MSARRSASKTILVSHRVFPETLAALSQIGDVQAPNPKPHFSRTRLAQLARRADAFLAFMPDAIDESWLLGAPKLRMIAAALKGYDNFDLNACTNRGIWLSNVPDLLTVPTSELAIGLMIGLARNIRAGDHLIRKRGRSRWEPQLYGVGIAGNTIGLIGMGMIGVAIAERLRAFEANLLYFDNNALAKEEENRLNVCCCTLPELLGSSDIIIAGLPLADSTYHLLNENSLGLCKKGVLLINPARGSVVDELAVARALEHGQLGGYAADVFECEDFSLPKRPKRIPPRLLRHPATLFTPHLGSAVQSVRRGIELRAATNIADWASGRPPRDAVNRPNPPG